VSGTKYSALAGAARICAVAVPASVAARIGFRGRLDRWHLAALRNLVHELRRPCGVDPLVCAISGSGVLRARSLLAALSAVRMGLCDLDRLGSGWRLDYVVLRSVVGAAVLGASKFGAGELDSLVLGALELDSLVEVAGRMPKGRL